MNWVKKNLLLLVIVGFLTALMLYHHNDHHNEMPSKNGENGPDENSPTVTTMDVENIIKQSEMRILDTLSEQHAMLKEDHEEILNKMEKIEISLYTSRLLTARSSSSKTCNIKSLQRVPPIKIPRLVKLLKKTPQLSEQLEEGSELKKLADECQLSIANLQAFQKIAGIIDPEASIQDCDPNETP